MKSDNTIYWGLKKQDKWCKHAQFHLNKVKNKYVNDNITITGHSLSGSIVEQIPKNLIDVSNKNDPISFFPEVQKVKKQNLIN